MPWAQEVYCFMKAELGCHHGALSTEARSRTWRCRCPAGSLESPARSLLASRSDSPLPGWYPRKWLRPAAPQVKTMFMSKWAGACYGLWSSGCRVHKHRPTQSRPKNCSLPAYIWANPVVTTMKP